jgi:hypothetical protein
MVALSSALSYSTIDKTVNGITYDVYTHSDANTSANAELWVQKGVTTNFNVLNASVADLG